MQIKHCASVIASEYFYLKASEILLFFHLMMAGRFGKVVFGGLDAYTICSSIREKFLPIRSYWIDKQNSEMREKERESWSKNAADPERAARIMDSIASKLRENANNNKLGSQKGNASSAEMDMRKAEHPVHDEC